MCRKSLSHNLGDTLYTLDMRTYKFADDECGKHVEHGFQNGAEHVVFRGQYNVTMLHNHLHLALVACDNNNAK